MLFGGLSEFDRALEDFATAIELDPEDSAAHGNRALVLTRMGRDDEAAQALDRAVELGADREDMAQRVEDVKAAR